MQDNGVALAAIGVLATCVGGLIWVIKKMFNEVQPLIEKGIEASENVAAAVQSGLMQNAAREEREQKQHSETMDQLVGLTKAISAIPTEVDSIVKGYADRNFDAITSMTVKTQHVATQVVAQEIVEHQTNTTQSKEVK